MAKYDIIGNDDPQPGDVGQIEDGRTVKVGKNNALFDVNSGKVVGSLKNKPVTTAITKETASAIVAKRWEKARDMAEVGLASISGKTGYDAWAELVAKVAIDAGNVDVPLRDRVMAMKFLGQATGFLDKAPASQSSNPDGAGLAMSTDVALELLRMLDARRDAGADIIDVTPTDPD